jgi:hypothetical protein
MIAASRYADRVVLLQSSVGDDGSVVSAPAVRTMISPVPVSPFRRDVVRDLGDRSPSRTEPISYRSRYVARDTLRVGSDAPGVAAALRTRTAAKFLSWVRFPRFTSEPVGDSIRVHIGDARYPGQDWASIDVMVPR